MKMNLRLDFFTFLALILGYSLSCSAKNLIVSPEKNYLRLEIDAQKNDIDIIKEGKVVRLNFFNEKLFESLSKELSEVKNQKGYLSNVENLNNSQILLELSNPNIELFSFYRDGTRSYVLDLWKTPGEVNSEEPKKKIAKLIQPKKVVKKKVTKKAPTIFVEKAKPKVVIKDKDFRYGASFYWPYQPLMPEVRTTLTVENKTPEFYYPIIDRRYKDSNLESHLQAAIESYRKEKYGFMSKSIKLFENQYPNHKEDELISYLKGNALLRQYINKKNSEYLNTSLVIFEELAERTQNYELKKSLYLYLIHFYLHNKNIIKGLENSKRLYVIGTQNFDEEAIYFSSEVILNSLARLRQKEKIEKFLEEPVVKKFLKEQVGVGYKIYVMLLNKQYDEVITYFESIKEGLQKPADPSIIFNVGEAYFQVAEYRKGIEQFMDFVKNYSFLNYSSYARNRVAISADLLDGKRSDVVSLYKRAIDLSSIPKARYEAKLRYVGYEFLRSKKEKRSQNILSLMEYSKIEEQQLDENLKKLLWSMRLRSFIVNSQYNKAITYYQTIPLNIMTFYDREVFEQDFHEALFGEVKKQFDQGDFAKVVKLSEVYKDLNQKYSNQDQSIDYYTAISYMELGFMKEFSEIMGNFKRANGSLKTKEFPVWVDRDLEEISFPNIYMKKFIAEKNWKDLEQYYLSLKTKNIYLTEKYLFSLFNQKKWKAYSDQTEKVFLRGEYKNLKEEEFSRLVVNYIISLRESKSPKYLRNLEAIVKDSYISEIPRLQEKILYTLAEEYSVNKLKNARSIATVWQEFDRSFPQSEYHSRVKYIYGISLIKSFDKEKGIQVLKEIVADKDSPDYLKKLARTELTFSGEITKI